MVKIKGWRYSTHIFRHGAMGSVYVSDAGRTIVVARKDVGGWGVFIDNEKIVPPFKTKEQALAYAMNYMRGHEDG